jgi:hypothetical protein
MIFSARAGGASSSKRHHLADRSPGRDEHRVTEPDSGTPQGLGVLIGSVRELLVSQLNARVPYRDLPRAATHLFQEQGFDVDRGHVGAGQGVEFPAMFWRDAAHVSKEALTGRQLVRRGGDVRDEPVRHVRYFGDEADLSGPRIGVVGGDDEVEVSIRAIGCSGRLDRQQEVVDEQVILDLEPDHPGAVRTPVGNRDRDVTHRCPPAHRHRDRRHHQRLAFVGTGCRRLDLSRQVVTGAEHSCPPESRRRSNRR